MKDAPVNACPDCGSTNRTMIQDAATNEVVWCCEQGHTWRDDQATGAAKPARSPGSSSKKDQPKKDQAQEDEKRESPRSK